MAHQVIDEGLERIAGKGPELRGGGPNHAPMAIQALTDLGHDGEVTGWLAGYAAQLAPAPAAVEPVSSQTWRQALGDARRLEDWDAYFRHELSEATWQDLVSVWCPRLLPGVMAGGTHGIIRVMHAVRTLEDEQTQLRLGELASALAYWASRYRVLPGVARLHGSLDLAQALSALPHLRPKVNRGGSPPRVVRQLSTLPDFPEAVNGLRPPGNIVAALHEMVVAGARLYLANAASHPLVFIHAITGPAALRVLLPYLPAASRPRAYALMWQAVAAWAAAFAAPGAVAATVAPTGNADEAVAHAIETGDEHAFKLTAACIAENQVGADEALLASARDWSTRLLAARQWDHTRVVAAGLATR